jgi:hypothetical protein
MTWSDSERKKEARGSPVAATDLTERRWYCLQ